MFSILKNNIHNLTRSFGFKIQKIPKLNIPDKVDSPYCVEFIGVPGVGKSTLFDEMKQSIKKNWIEFDEFQKFVDYNYKDRMLVNSKTYQDLTHLKINGVVNGKNAPTDKTKKLSVAYKAIKQDYIINQFNKHHIVLMEEHLMFHYRNQIKQLFKKNKNKFDSFIEGRAIIYCYASPKRIAEQVKIREKKTGKLVPAHNVGSYEQLLKKIKNQLQGQEESISFFKNKIPVLEVDTEERLSFNVDKINEFLRKL